MLFQIPTSTEELAGRLGELDQLRAALGREITNPSPWLGTLRRLAKASSVESSVSIEGFEVPQGEALAIVSGSATEADDENRKAVADYARAMDHVGVMTLDPVFKWSDRVILDLHFDACYFQQDKGPGRWRTGPISVTGSDGRQAYEGPEADRVAGLMAEVVEWLQNGDLDTHVVVRAAMAHLHTVSVHPFRDGNGRISRIVQSLVLAREGLLSPEFASIEEYLANNTPEYYAVLQRVQGGSYSPERDASEWVAFCVEAHISQARRRLDQIAEASSRWRYLERLAPSRGWPDRLVIALEQSLIGGTDRTKYEQEAEISTATASNDFRRLLDAGLVSQVGRGRSTRYFASETLRSEVGEAVAYRERT
ncbi:MAG: Fic family protein [Gaiellaceae bacterium MAG52_C11]|nr:Fic family protein [Candidatus Gaiellasilicea maunaloa]